MQLARLRSRDLVVVALASGPATVADISGQTGLSDAAVYWHIGRLEAGGLVELAGFTRAGHRRRRAKLFKVVRPTGFAPPVPAPRRFPWRQYHDHPLCPHCGQPDAVHSSMCPGIRTVPLKDLAAAVRLGALVWHEPA